MRRIKELRVYCECYEQGLYLLNYILDNKYIIGIDHKVLYTKPNNFSLYYSESIISQLFSRKDFDGLISVVDEDDTEHPIVTIEFSTAVPTDDHIVQRFDVMYWSTYYQTPCIKISPTLINNINFGGGNKMKIWHEYYTTLNMGGVYYHVDWPLISGSDLVMTDSDKVSCPPFLNELKDILNGMINSYCNSSDDNEYFTIERNKYSQFVHSNYVDDRFDISPSTRIQFDEFGKIILKFNRYGHGMDPERGMLFFLNNRFKTKPIIKFVVQRKTREKYMSLYDGTNTETIMKFIDSEVLSNNNVVTFDIAFELFKKATNTFSLFRSSIIENNTITINDNDLINNLNSNTSVINSLLHFGEKIILNDLKNNTIAEIKWNLELVENYYSSERQRSLSIPKRKLPVVPLSNRKINEDVVTYSCMSLFLKNNMKNIAVSYPGAQGDRKLLQGEGRETKRDYVDIISVHKYSDTEYNVFLQENKRKISETQKSDVDKLISIKNDEDKINELNNLISKVYVPIIVKGYYIGVGGQESPMAQGEARFDYLMYIMINENRNIEWQILSSNPIIFEIFKNISNSDNSLKGEIKLNYPMYIIE